MSVATTVLHAPSPYQIPNSSPNSSPSTSTNTELLHLPLSTEHVDIYLKALSSAHVHYSKQQEANAAKGASKGGNKGKSSGKKSLLEAAGGNAAIAAILAQYQGFANMSSDNSVFADYTALLEISTSAESTGTDTGTSAGAGAGSSGPVDRATLFAQAFGDEEAINHTAIQLNDISHVLPLALNKSVIHCSSRELDDKLFLNTCDIFAKMPVWTLCFDVSACPECGDITGIMVSRQTFFMGKKAKDKDLEPLATTNTVKGMFCEALALSISRNKGPFSSINGAILLDHEQCIIDTLLPILNEADVDVDVDANGALNQEDSDEVIVPDFVQNNAEHRVLLNALKYVLYFMTHQGELKDAYGKAVNLQNNKDTTQDESLHSMAAVEKALDTGFEHYFF